MTQFSIDDAAHHAPCTPPFRPRGAPQSTSYLRMMTYRERSQAGLLPGGQDALVADDAANRPPSSRTPRLPTIHAPARKIETAATHADPPARALLGAMFLGAMLRRRQ